MKKITYNGKSYSLLGQYNKYMLFSSMDTVNYSYVFCHGYDIAGGKYFLDCIQAIDYFREHSGLKQKQYWK
jgi:hypothetical protein